MPARRSVAAETTPARLVPAGGGRDRRLTDLAMRVEDPDHRSHGRRDRDRIYYSAAWRRLGGVTQVISPLRDGMVLHTRLTHSEKVSQVAQSIAEDLLRDDTQHATILALGGLDVDVAQAASLAHDLGHPPFGHIGEEILDDIARRKLKLPNGFEGNAQSFRIVTKLERRSTQYDGLDLTCATLAATAKYPWTRVKTLTDDEHESTLKTDPDYRKHWKKFSAYGSESDELADSRAFLPATYATEVQTLEASLMDVADDITYAVHDLEDFFLAGLLDVRAVIDELDGSSSGEDDERRPERARCFSRLAERLKLDYADYFDQRVYDEQLENVSTLLRRWLTADYRGEPYHERRARERLSKLIGELTSQVIVQETLLWPGGPHLGLRQSAWHQVQILKEITREFIVQRSDIALLQRGQQEVLRNLVEMLGNWKDSRSDFGRLPLALRDEIDIARGLEEGKVGSGYGKGLHPRRGPENQCLIDYLCTFTDAGCLSLHETLTGRRMPRIGSGF